MFAKLARDRAKNAATARELQERERRLEEETETECDEEEKPIKVQQLIHDTERHHMGDACRRDCRNRIKRMMAFWKQSDQVPNGHVQRAVQKVPLGECNKEQNWFHANQPQVGPFKEDLHCDNASADHCSHFLASIKTLDNGNCGLADDMRKCCDAVMWGAKTAK